MNKNNLSDDDLKKYLTKFDDINLNNIYKNETHKNHEFSPEFEDKMQILINKNSPLLHKPLYFKKIIVSLCIIIITVFTLSLNVEAIRSKIINVIKEIYTEFTMLKISSDDNLDNDLNTYTSIPEPSYIPNGFEEIERIDTGNGCMIRYQHDNLIQIGYEIDKINNSTFIIDTEDAIIEFVNINGHEAQYVQKGEFVQLFWNDNDYSYFIDQSFLSSDITQKDKDELINIAKSIKK